MNSHATRGPLTGIRVLDLTSYLAGPYGCALLGDLGADVIKIEPPDGDMMRHFPSTLPGASRAFLGTNKNKRGMVIDLKHADGRDILYRLVDGADVFVESFRPSVPPRLRIDYATLSKRNPGLIYCALSGYGDSGPMRDAAGFDQVLQAWTGIATFQGADGDPELVRGSIVDYYSSALIAMAVNAALFHRANTGEGQYVALSLLRTALAMQAGRFVWAQGESRDVDRELQPGRIAGIHPTRDGFMFLSAHANHFWQALCEALELPQLADDPRFADMRRRADNADALLPLLHEALRRKSAAEWVELMQGKVPCAVVRPIEDAFLDPQVAAEDLVAEVAHPSLGSYRTIAKPARFSRTPGPPTTHAPGLGEHTDAILAELGIAPEEIARLRRDGAVG
jgi:crotonobetainyl-CoA:carnitine CoA-transferase CaiB-like acyl-CoA transferase